MNQVISHSQKFFTKLEKLRSGAIKKYSGEELDYVPCDFGSINAALANLKSNRKITRVDRCEEGLLIGMNDGTSAVVGRESCSIPCIKEQYLAVFKETGRKEFTLRYLCGELNISRGALELALMM